MVQALSGGLAGWLFRCPGCVVLTVVLVVMEGAPALAAGEVVAAPESGRAVVAVAPDEAAWERLTWFGGQWKFVATHLDEKGHALATSKGTEENKPILSGRVLQRTYQTDGNGAGYSSVGLMTYQRFDDSYVCLWFDDVSSNGPMHMQGRFEAENKQFVWNMTRSDDQGRSHAFKIVERFTDEQTRESVTYEIVNGKVIKRLDVRYRRHKPCPPAIHLIGDW